MSPEVKGKSPRVKSLQSPLRPSPHRTTSQISSVSVEANLTDSETSGRALLSKDPKYTRQRTLSHPNGKQARPEGNLELAAATISATKSVPAPVVQRTLSAPGTPGRGNASISSTSGASTSRTPSIHSLAVTPSAAAASTSGSGGSSPSRKGKEKALEAVEIEGVDVEGELVAGHDGDATKGLRELVRRTTIGEGGGTPWRKEAGTSASTLQGKSACRGYRDPEAKLCRRDTYARPSAG